MRLRPIKKEDSAMLYEWRNDFNVRKNSFNKNLIRAEDHDLWFDEFLNNDFKKGYILEVNGISVGTIRFNIENTVKAEVSFLISPTHQRKGYGQEILKLGVVKFFNFHPSIKVVYGRVLRGNKASRSIFEKLSYKLMKSDKEELIFEIKRNENWK